MTASGAVAAPVGTISASAGVAPNPPVVLTAGDQIGQTVTFTNSDKSKSTSALVVTGPTGDPGFSITADTCSGTALGPRKSCSVTVAYPGTGPTTAARNASVTITPKTPPPSAVTVFFTVAPRTPIELCAQLGGISTLQGRTWLACHTRGFLPATADPFAVYDEWFTGFQVTCAANGYPGSFVHGLHFTGGYNISVSCDNYYAAERALCADNGQDLTFVYDTVWECGGVALADQAAADALATQFKSFCDIVDPPGSYPLEVSVVPDGTGVRATFTCRDPSQPIPA